MCKREARRDSFPSDLMSVSSLVTRLRRLRERRCKECREEFVRPKESYKSVHDMTPDTDTEIDTIPSKTMRKQNSYFSVNSRSPRAPSTLLILFGLILFVLVVCGSSVRTWLGGTQSDIFGVSFPKSVAPFYLRTKASSYHKSKRLPNLINLNNTFRTPGQG
jgi:hypothetical protein